MQLHRSFLVTLGCSMLLVCAVDNQVKKCSPVNFDDAVFAWSKTLAESLHLIKNKHYQTIDPEQAFIQSINAFVHTLDPHSSFMDPKNYKSILETTQGEFCGIGVIIDSRRESENETLTILDVLPASPAQQAGLCAQDKIVQVDDEVVKGLSTEEITAKLKGKRHTKVMVTIQRPAYPELMSFTITRDIIKEQNTLCYHLKEQNIFYLALALFSESSAKQIEAALKKCIEKRAQGLILDLRNNAGGLLTSAIDIAGIFLPKGSKIVVTKDKEQKVLETYTTQRNPLAIGSIPIFIVVNNFTASAAEIVAGCLRHYAQSASPNSGISCSLFLVGTTTFGKGSVQEVIPVSNDCALKLTTALYYLPDDSSIQGIGITPDFIIEPKISPTKDMQWFTDCFGREKNLKNSIKQEKSPEKKQSKDKSPAQDSWQAKKMEQISTDYCIVSTARLIQMLHMALKVYPDQGKSRQQMITLLKKYFTTQDTLVLEEITI